MSLFLHSDYRTYISEIIAQLPRKGHGEVSKIAKAIGVHQSLVSLVLAGDRDLSLEQGHDLAMYLGFTEIESEYFSLLIQFSRAGNTRYKKFVQDKMEKIRHEASQLSKRVVQDRKLTEQQRAVIYSSWLYSAIRLYTSTDEKGRSVEQIQSRFHLPRPKVVEILNFLESVDLVTTDQAFYKMGTQRTFLEHGSPHLLKHHSNWRIKALEQADRITEKDLMFTSPVSLSKADFVILREEIAELIKGFLKRVADSPAEEMACLNIDFFWLA